MFTLVSELSVAARNRVGYALLVCLFVFFVWFLNVLINN